MRVFLDFEASSLGEDSYPIEVGWVFEDGREESHLIRPAPGWIDWDAGAEAIHGIGRDRLAHEGEPHDLVARRILEQLAPHHVYVSAPSWDGKWLSVLFRASAIPRHAMRLIESDEAMIEAAKAEFGAGENETRAAELVARLRRESEAHPPVHRALADARQERELWLRVREEAIRLAAQSADGFDLSRFKTAQAPIFEQALAELRSGQKRGHWMWFVFPQIEGLGASGMARHYAISGLAEARAYLADPLLGPRLRACVEAVLAHADRSAEAILGPVDALKLRSSLTLFREADPQASLFQRALDQFYDGRPDPRTLDRLA